MSTIDVAEVDRIAHLARLAIAESDRAGYARELSAILDLVEEMNAADTTDVAPLANPLDAVQRLRPDSVTEGDRREEFQRIAPATERGLYLVPRVIE